MKILVVGTGAREHAICESLKEDAEIYSIMSNTNPGIARISQFQVASESDMDQVKNFALKNKVEMAIIGPESPLEQGIVNVLENEGISCVGPSQEAAKIETDKAFMRGLFENYKIPGSVAYQVFDNYDNLSLFLDEFNKDVVVKPVGLTGGKGVKIVGEHLEDNQEAKGYAKHIMETRMGGHPRVVIEEKLVGEEFTVQAFSDGEHVIPMPAAQDHPHAFEGDQGPITGGMGSYSDKDGLLPFLSQKDYDESVKIMQHTVNAIKEEAGPYKGILYGQFMLCKDGPKLVEYNARFGDPEAMNVLPLLKTSMVDICQGIIQGNLRKADFERKATVCKYIVPQGYPETKAAGEKIQVNEKEIEKAGALVYYAAVNQENKSIYTSSSRALALVGRGDNIQEAEEICEEATRHVTGDLYHRKDVGTAALLQKRIDHMNHLRGN
ncbi:phosphoribosylamine--glycine ligase [Methanobacterium alkalithermotolerans]|uniref:Phosphoribosylamine--glycine ligase n=1 Tax=Methanobacterium alkalithermotolerans TaxID=2731220 RepID=A0A8T8K4E8_9EURY|nr:phosphoribosylamine--glycine ligase [Methanobacterium alkalithermotolerans]QUH23418.1 phosphoribosylamine--glycine ligase [Methanobacterium alkalithermotolerans]